MCCLGLTRADPNVPHPEPPHLRCSHPKTFPPCVSGQAKDRRHLQISLLGLKVMGAPSPVPGEPHGAWVAWREHAQSQSQRPQFQSQLIPHQRCNHRQGPQPISSSWISSGQPCLTGTPAAPVCVLSQLRGPRSPILCCSGSC